ncbi:MAG: hypothetical protein DSM106950_35270 [Stigonema ocellatum SAG 48.90 = DSM 106950]|nr:hypothetical protein [Stigonema ocellatum SAG 48.90 = DSM 106950]
MNEIDNQEQVYKLKSPVGTAFLLAKNEIKRIINTEVIPLTADILTEAAIYEDPYDLKPQDALVYASVISG